MELKNIQTFVKIIEEGNFTKAATALGYAQSTITTQIHQLEKDLGSPLFTRNNSAVILTEFGREYLPLAESMISIMEEMETLKGDPTLLTGTLRVGIVESLFYSDFIEVIKDFTEECPNVTLEFFTSSSADLHTMLAENRVDIIICFLQPFDYSSYDMVFNYNVNIYFTTTPSNPLAIKENVTLEQIAKYPIIITEEVSIYHQELHRIFNKAGLTLKDSCKLQSSHAILKLIKMTDSISFLPEYTIRHDLKAHSLITLKTAFEPSSAKIIGAVRKEKWHSPQLLKLIELTKSKLVRS